MSSPRAGFEPVSFGLGCAIHIAFGWLWFPTRFSADGAYK